MEQTLGFSHFIHQADGIAMTILAIMMIMSCGTWYVIVTKFFSSLLAQKKSQKFLERFWSSGSLEEVHALIHQHGTNEPFGRLVHQGLDANQVQRSSTSQTLQTLDDEYVVRSLKRSIEDDALQMEKGLTFVATVASSAPFVGLFGTVWGIYNALMAIGISGQGTLDKVAGPIGEALIMTGIGLVVAIPAAIAYNFFSHKNRRVLGKLDSFAHDVFTLINKGVKSRAPARKGAM